MANKINIVITAEDKASKPIHDVSKSTDELSGSTSRFHTVMATAGKAAFAVGVAGMVALSAGAVTAAKASYDQVKAVEEARFGLQAYEKDASKVNAVLSDLITYAKSDTGVLFNRKDLFAAASTLKMYGDETENLTEHVKILSKGVAQGKTTFQELSAIVGRAAAKGRLDAVDFDMLIERGIGIDRSFRGAKVSSEDLWDALDKAIPAETLAGRADTIEGRMIRLQSAWRGVGDAILGVDDKTSRFIEGGLGDLIQKGIGGLTDRLRDLKPVISDIFQNIRASFSLLATGQFKEGMFAGVVNEDSKVVEILLGIRDAAKKAWDILKPAFDEVGKVVQEHLTPALKELWEIVEPAILPGLKALGLFVGGYLVATLWGLAKVLEVTAWVATGMAKAISGGLNLVRDVGTNVANFVIDSANKITWFFSDLPGHIGLALGDLSGRFSRFVSEDVPNFVFSVAGWFAQLPGRVASSVLGLWDHAVAGFNSFRDKATAWAASLIDQIVGWFRSLPQRIYDALMGAASKVVSWVNDLVGGFSAGLKIGSIGHASGTNASSGGWKMVGEHGPEPVYLPQGAQVTPAYQARQGVNVPQSSGHTVIIENYNSYNERDDNRFFRDLGFALELAS